MKFQIQIIGIDNGFLVQLPGIESKTHGIEQEPRSIYCEDLSAVTVCLNQIWPRDVKLSVLE